MSHSSDVVRPSGSPAGSTHGRRVVAGLGIGALAAAAIAVAGGRWEYIILGGWASTASVVLAWTWASIGRLDPVETERRATQEDETRTEAGLVLLITSVMSLVGVALGLVHAATLHGPAKVASTVLCVIVVILSWCVVHTVFTLRYAHEYFTAGGGIEFGPDAAAYSDFAYVAFTVGMTYQVSDTDITNRRIRATVTRQALLSFAFGTFIVAMTINVLAGLVRPG